MNNMLAQVKKLADIECAQGSGEVNLFYATMEEAGEYAAARLVEVGDKDKELRESSQSEAVDLVIGALSLFYANGGTDEQLEPMALIKLDKWKKQQRKRIDALTAALSAQRNSPPALILE
jgi:hypothetical protein